MVNIERILESLDSLLINRIGFIQRVVEGRDFQDEMRLYLKKFQDRKDLEKYGLKTYIRGTLQDYVLKENPLAFYALFKVKDETEVGKYTMADGSEISLTYNSLCQNILTSMNHDQRKLFLNKLMDSLVD